MIVDCSLPRTDPRPLRGFASPGRLRSETREDAMDSRLSAENLVEELRLALLSAEPERAAGLLSRLMLGPAHAGNVHARQLAFALGELRDSWPDCLEQGGDQQILRGLAAGPFFCPQRVH